MASLKSFIRTLTPPVVLSSYHALLSRVAAWYYCYPSRAMMVIGVTGTNGKTTTCTMIAHVLEGTGYTVGMATTAEFKIGSTRILNDKKMTMLGRFQLQKLLRQMADAQCKYAVVEVSSEGIAQHRIDTIDFDMGVFTNLTPEHIASHGSFENYQHAKGKFFAHLMHTAHKYAVHENGTEMIYVDGAYGERSVPEQIAKTIIVNSDDPHAPYFYGFDAQEKYCFGMKDGCVCAPEKHHMIRATDVILHEYSSEFYVGGVKFELPLPGAYNVSNALAAITVGLTRGMDFTAIAQELKKITVVPGRFERIDEGQPFEVIVDYAPEVASMEQLYTVIDTLKKNRVIHVLGSCGGGRDADRRPRLGAIAAVHADLVIVTNEDPYDDDPLEIMRDVAAGAREQGCVEGENLMLIEDRRDAIRYALQSAHKGDIVLITGKGSEQAICIADGKKIPWDDRTVTRALLRTV